MLEIPTMMMQLRLQVLLKMDQHGSCEEICMKDIATNRELNFVGFTPAMFQEVTPAGCVSELR